MMDAHPVEHDPRFAIPKVRAPWDLHPFGMQLIGDEIRERPDLGLTSDPLQLKWRDALITLSMMLPANTFYNLFDHTRVRTWTGGALDLWCQNESQRDILQSRYAGVIKREACCETVRVTIWSNSSGG